MPRLGAPLDFAKLEGQNLRAHQLGAAPASPVTGQLYYNTADNTLYWFDGTVWISTRQTVTPDATTSTKGVIQLAGDLAGTAVSPQIAAGVITDVEVAAANKDGAAATAGMRTLGLGVQQAMPGSTRLNAITQANGAVNLGANLLSAVADPQSAQDAATKAYVDNVAQGLDAKQSVKAAATTNVATMSGPQTVDGISLIAGDRVLLTAQGNTADKGIWVVAAGAWTRAADLNASSEAPGAYVWVEQGTVNADTGWVCTADQTFTINVSDMPWTQFSGAGSITAGAGLTKTSNTLDVGGTANRITVGTDTVDIAATYVGQGSITTLGTITTGVWNGTAIPIANGGTGSSTAAGARTALGVPGVYNNNGVHGAGTTITISAATHGLGAKRALLVQVNDYATGAVLLPDVVVNNVGDVTITFAATQIANSMLVTVVG